jgi:hypothetical protein
MDHQFHGNNDDREVRNRYHLRFGAETTSVQAEEHHGHIQVDNSTTSTFRETPLLENRNNVNSNERNQPEIPLQSNEICCSVLTTVVDFCMMIPTKVYEPEEYDENQQLMTTFSSCTEESDPSNLLVPVMRIFGPIIRRQQRNDTNLDSTTNNSYMNRRPYQSACLYIHGAFPYMLARPTLAGLDGSGTNHCPWDSPIKVQQMLPVIQDSLEKAVQETNASFLNGSKENETKGKDDDGNNDAEPGAVLNNSKNNSTTPVTSINHHRVIRQITIVMGRGFYGYCSGPTAPFIRIEYYNPKDRWKIKRCLEYGISFSVSSSMIHSPEFFFPKRRTHTEHPMENDYQHTSNNRLDDEMNNALKFHCFEAHIPYTMQFFKDYNLAGMTYLHVSEPTSIKTKRYGALNDNDSEFYENGPIQFRQPLPSSIRKMVQPLQSTNNTPGIEAQSSNQFKPWVFLDSNTPAEYIWERSDTSNVDVNVGIPDTNSLMILKKMTSCDVELDIHVSNISNQFDVMTNLPSQYEERQRTHWRAVPSLHEIWKQERLRMSKLLPPREDFLSFSNEDNLSTIDPHHTRDNLNKKDHKKVVGNITPPFTLNVKPEDAVLPGAELAREGMKKLIQVTDGLEQNFGRVMHQIVSRHARSIHQTDNEILQHQKQQGTEGNDIENLTPSYDETIEALNALGNLFADGLSSSPDNVDPNESTKMINVAEKSFHESSGNNDEQNMSQESIPSNSDSLLICKEERTQSRGKDLLTNLSQACSSSMLQGVKDCSLLDEYVLSQRVERGDGIVGNHFDNIDDVIDPETLAPYEIFDDEDDDLEGDENDEDAPHHDNNDDAFDEMQVTNLLSTLSAQANQPTKYLNDDSSVDSLELLKNHGLPKRDIIAESFDENSKTIPLHYSLGKNVENVSEADVRELRITTQLGSCILSQFASNMVVKPKALPPKGPNKTETILLSKQLHRNESPPLTNDVEYKPVCMDAQEKNTLYKIAHAGYYIAPEFRAPTRIDVQSWYRNQSKRINPTHFDNSVINKRVKKNAEKESSKKLGAKLVQAPMDAPCNVEEVRWKHSQDSASLLSQGVDNSQNSSSVVELNEDHSQSSKEFRTTFPKNSIDETTFQKNSIDERPPLKLFGSLDEAVGNQGGCFFAERGGGDLKATTRHSQRSDETSPLVNDTLQCPVSIMAIEIFVHCRSGRAGISDSTAIAMTPDSLRDKISAILYVMSEDPGGGDPLQFQECGCIFVPVSREIDVAVNSGANNLDICVSGLRKSLPATTLGISTPLSVECVKDERQLLLRLASIVRRKDPDMLLSWDTQASGLGYIIERGSVLGKDSTKSPDASREIDMARLLGRTPTKSKNDDLSRLHRTFESKDSTDATLTEMKHSTYTVVKDSSVSNNRWDGSGLGTEWDERVGAGAAAASIVSSTSTNTMLMVIGRAYRLFAMYRLIFLS